MSKLDKNQRVRTNRQRQVFDLSHDYLFTATTGQLRPVSHDLLQPGDTVSCKFDFFLRSMPLSTAAMIDVDFMIDYFFVPLDLIWLGFDAWWSRTRSVFFVNYDEVNQSNRSPLPAIDALPMLDLKNVFESINATDDKWQSMRLLDDLGFSGMVFHNASGFVHPIHNAGVITDGDYPSVFPWQMCAYECIYMHYYRDDEREAFNPAAYNFPIQINNPGARNGFPRMRYVNRMDDYFTSTKLSPLVSNVNNDPEFLHDFNVDLGDNVFDYDVLFQSGTAVSNHADVNVLNTAETGAGGSTTDSRAVNQLRALFAQEKLLHVMNMTHKDYDSQVLARLGYDVPKDVRHQIHHLGHDTCQLNIQEIVSGSNTFNGEIGSSLGDLAGQGKAISRNFKGVKSFTAPCHGVLMTIWTCRTRPKYTTSALRKDMLQQIYDFFTPELDDLGMQPQYRYESDLINHRMGAGVGTLYEDYRYTITGWNYRYEYLKRNINRSSLAFMRSSDGLQERYNPQNPLGFNSYSQWSHSRVPLDMGLKLESSQYKPEDDYYTRPHFDLYKVQPDELNNVMLVSWLKNPPLDDQGVPTEDWSKFPWLIYQRDPFIVDGRFSCKKVSAMSLYSMPKLV